jgi:hypothetical protein
MNREKLHLLLDRACNECKEGEFVASHFVDICMREQQESLVNKTIRAIHKHPGKTSYYDNTQFVKLNISSEGYWLRPGEYIAIVKENN